MFHRRRRALLALVVAVAAATPVWASVVPLPGESAVAAGLLGSPLRPDLDDRRAVLSSIGPTSGASARSSLAESETSASATVLESVPVAPAPTPPAAPEPAAPEASGAGVAAVVGATAVRRSGAGTSSGFGPLGSPDVGAFCADGLDAEALTSFFAEPIGTFQGADYQRATRLPDDRVLWTFQDAFVSGRLVHNVAMVQSGRCFTPLGESGRSWLLPSETRHMQRWHWILDVAVDRAGGRAHAFVVEMNETGPGYLTRTRPVALRRVVLDLTSLSVVDVVEEEPTGLDLYGWSVTADDDYTYLYSHCYRQFGFDTPLGSDPCTSDVKLARVPLGRLDAPREYWSSTGWVVDAAAATPVIDGTFVLSGNNPAQIRFDGQRYVLVEKRDDWWGTTIEFGVADRPEGPFRHVDTVDEPSKCDRSTCNTYFASWVPWSADGSLIWSIGHNRWNGAETADHLDVYRPTFHAARP